MAIVNLTYASTRAMIKVLRQALASDPLFSPDKTGPSRTAETMVLDQWGYQVRDFPIVVVEGVPGKSRRMGIGGDTVRPFFGVPLSEEPGGTQSSRTFDVPLALVPQAANAQANLPEPTVVELRYSGDITGMDTPPPWLLPVQQKIVASVPINYITLTGPNIGPESAFPAKFFEASVKDMVPTGQIFGGWHDLTLNITGCARSTQGRERLADRLWSLIWFEKKKALRKLGIVVLDVQHSGYKEEPYGADQLYFTRFAVSAATEFEAIVQFAETVQDVSVVGTAVSTL